MDGNPKNRLIAAAPAAAFPESAWIEGDRIRESFAAYLSDESKLQGQASRLSFPTTEPELLAVLQAARAANMPITVCGARTGITGGAVPSGGWLISLDKMNRCFNLRHAQDGHGYILTCQPGLTLETLHKALETNIFPGAESWNDDARAAFERLRAGPRHLFPPDPTERSASLGGMIACNASGARTFHYGATRRYIERLRLVLASGHTLDLSRSRTFAAPDGSFQLDLQNGQIRSGRIPDYRAPGLKNAAGYFAEPGMDLLDLFIGAEGTLGIVTEADLRLVPAPEAILAAVGFFPTESDVIRFVESARRGLDIAGAPESERRPLALEYFDPRSLDLLRDQKRRVGPSSPIPNLPVGPCAALYIELATVEARLEPAAEALLENLAACGSDPDQAWCATTDAENEGLKAFRHALPEAVNQRIGERAARFPGLTKLGTDFAVPDPALPDMMAAYHAVLEPSGLEHVIFGHIGNSHVHVNILPRNLEDHVRGKELYLELARSALNLGGTVSGEHGIGKLKKPMLRLMLGDQGLAAMRQVKRVFDPDHRLNPGNLFDLSPT
jgi:D-lactate dehydrogenase (cytochrome)